MDSWNEVVVGVSTKDLDKATAIVTAVSTGGIYVEDYSDMLNVLPTIGHYDYISSELLAKDKDHADIHFYLYSEEELHEATTFVKERLESEGISFSIIFKTVSDNDWSESWKQYFHARKIGERVVICPSWEEYLPLGNECVVVLDPGMSFGTGDHESTQLSIILLEKCNLDHLSVLDIGTGSGILGITAIKLGAKTVTAIDIDSVAVGIAKENATINEVSRRFTSILGNVYDGDFASTIPNDFDLITANVVADFHIANSKLYYDKLKLDGSLIVSGIIEVQLEDVEKSLMNCGFQIIESKCLNGWCAILSKK